ncbi:hypothetical protein LZ32DRAFT_609417 [Colletotrichum eremochloae]|nr:hypothetical protein LZ32DRAFT_609417 [Colletotrichum eremochloae]
MEASASGLSTNPMLLLRCMDIALAFKVVMMDWLYVFFRTPVFRRHDPLPRPLFRPNALNNNPMLFV